jgi:hypothetical protein
MSEKNNDRSNAGRRTDAAPSPHTVALNLLHAKLAEAELTEGQLLAWLKEREAVSPGIFALRSIPTRRLEILIEQWEDTVLPQLLP